MSRRSRSVAAGVVGTLVAVGCGALIWFLLGQHHVDRAGAWAGIISLAALPLAVWSLWLALPGRNTPTGTTSPKAPDGGAHADSQINVATGSGTNYAVQNGQQHIHEVPTEPRQRPVRD